ncbi:ExbD/TolR family protein [Ponticoccus sp. SC2-23]|uniref:ExbD/TolR family protein n=1 Tax=Alexandriicola marinus TaxID=2081710 RepID=UPI000FD9992A|nr:ExbD/TolR family protein [Alexandriicola marinus]MBM1221534.1 ExbD/TolR family protein [Ponticoccus sp. SC6-9]MBM1226575.1 ExbD/TolR family protein [Ponticoccus sp. SC6-15]MBM1230526.1 ExbD/TolR family protein [Ponticoccus sp. SC6-38]MBM1235049.1 ExbD/TolR family protein [Ponticoccus sp. SC6-45]MBM1239547.1 ExbD/TolR family protein [Ponticoccus sp. SC6-49]MBM1243329.1 ExbD/TolR family protein [Ponticoccus sp. SC2-64]MBM1248573.1 ExbD/TolR family protein [Ponticoccus sp. SC6-42]MBM1253158
MGAGVMKSESGGGGSRRRRRRGRTQPMAEINVTPFVDVMLVLLIIFMVAAPLLTVGVPVELPKTAANALPTDEEEPLTVTITGEGFLLIQNTQVTDDELVPRLQGIAAERTSDRIFVRADGANVWNRVAEVMGALNAAGFSEIGLVTDIGGPSLDGSDQAVGDE